MTGVQPLRILMYHSISNGPGPLEIARETFRMQLDELERRGLRGVTLRESMQAVRPSGAVAITFDDGYHDFADAAFPEIASRGWGCTLFLASGLLDAGAQWNPDGRGTRRLIEWKEARTLAERGVELGGHSVHHPDLTRLHPDEARREIADCRDAIERQTGSRVDSFAAPYGHTTAAVRQDISRIYARAVGTTLAVATAASDPYDLPRIEMWYFQSRARWSAFLDGATAYFTTRQLLRRARALAGFGAGSK
jgi:peptidoglycan/xylan/chitin deacetylase (PgdA/CDA1 family)